MCGHARRCCDMCSSQLPCTQRRRSLRAWCRRPGRLPGRGSLNCRQLRSRSVSPLPFPVCAVWLWRSPARLPALAQLLLSLRARPPEHSESLGEEVHRFGGEVSFGLLRRFCVFHAGFGSCAHPNSIEAPEFLFEADTGLQQPHCSVFCAAGLGAWVSTTRLLALGSHSVRKWGLTSLLFSRPGSLLLPLKCHWAELSVRP